MGAAVYGRERCTCYNHRGLKLTPSEMIKNLKEENETLRQEIKRLKNLQVMNYAIEILEEQLESDKISLSKVTDDFKPNVQENIDDLEWAISNLKKLESI